MFLSEQFVEIWQGRLLNVHPAILPAFKGAKAHKLVLEARARITGCTVHFVEVFKTYLFFEQCYKLLKLRLIYVIHSCRYRNKLYNSDYLKVLGFLLYLLKIGI